MGHREPVKSRLERCKEGEPCQLSHPASGKRHEMPRGMCEPEGGVSVLGPRLGSQPHKKATTRHSQHSQSLSVSIAKQNGLDA
jgi:hypothetical protein